MRGGDSRHRGSADGRLMNKQYAVNALWIINLHSRHGHRAPCISTGYPVVHAPRPPSRCTYIREFMIHSWNRSYVEVVETVVFFLLYVTKREEKERWVKKNNLSSTREGSRGKRLYRKLYLNSAIYDIL